MAFSIPEFPNQTRASSNTESSVGPQAPLGDILAGAADQYGARGNADDLYSSGCKFSNDANPENRKDAFLDESSVGPRGLMDSVFRMTPTQIIGKMHV